MAISHRMTLVALVAIASLAGAQQPAAAPPQAPALPIPEVGSVAPDFTFEAITKDGKKAPAKLSDYKGQTVVLWFFIRARTRG